MRFIKSLDDVSHEVLLFHDLGCSCRKGDGCGAYYARKRAAIV